MAVDTRDRRASLIGLGLPVPRLLPGPGGSLDSTGDRLQLSMLYRFFEDAVSGALEAVEAQQAIDAPSAGPVEAQQTTEAPAIELVEAQQTTEAPAIGIIEAQQTVDAPSAGPVEAQQTTEAPAIELVEATGTSASGQDQGMEAQSSPSSAAFESVESNEAADPGVAAVSFEAPGLSVSDIAALIEALRYLRPTGDLNLESNYPTTEQTAILALEAAAGVSSALIGVASIDWESVRKLIIPAAVPVESKRLTTVPGGADWESLVFSSFPMLKVVESLNLLSTTGQSALESAIEVSQSQQQLLEALARAIESGAVPTEFTELIGSATIVIQTGRVNIEALRLLKVVGPGPLEGKRLLMVSAREPFESGSTPASAGNQQAESVRLLVLEAAVALEANQGSGDQSAVAVIEALRALLILGTIPWSHSDDEQPSDHTRISGRGTLVVRRSLQAVLIVARGSSGG